MRGRKDDLEYKRLSTKPISLKSIEDAGFDGIWIDRTLYQKPNLEISKIQPSEEELEKQLHVELGIVPIVSKNGSLMYYSLRSKQMQE